MRDEDVAKLLERLVKIEIAILSVNPDPKQTIQDYRDQKAAQQRAADHPCVGGTGILSESFVDCAEPSREETLSRQALVLPAEVQ